MDDNEWNDMVYGEDEELNSLSSTGEHAIDRLLQAITAEHVLPTIYTKLGIVSDQTVQNKANGLYWNNTNDWKKRHCAITTITQISDHMYTESDEVCAAMNKILQLFGSDKNPRIKFAAINAIGQLSNDHFELLSSKFNQQILNALKSALSLDNHIKISTHACAALINFVPQLEQQQIQNALQPLLAAAMTLLQKANSSWQTANNSTLKSNYQKAQEQALTAIAALAEAAGDLFDQFYDNFAPILMTIIKSATNKEMTEIRCRAIECMGRFGAAVGVNKFRQHSTELMMGTVAFFKSGSNGNNIDITGLEDDSFIEVNIKLWPKVLEGVGVDEFVKYLPTICEILDHVAKISIISNRNNEVQGDDFDYEEFVDNNDDDNMALIETRTGFIALDAQKMENKLAALMCIEIFIGKYGVQMVPFINKFFQTLLECIKCKYSFELRSDSARSAPIYIKVMLDAVKKNMAQPQQLKQMSHDIINVLINVMDEGRKSSSTDQLGGGGESAAIATVTDSLLNILRMIDPTDSPDYNPSNSS